MIFPDFLADAAGGLLQNGITVGGLVAILMTLFLEATAPRRSRIEVEFDLSVLPKIREFLGAFADRNGWDAKNGAPPAGGRRGNTADADERGRA